MLAPCGLDIIISLPLVNNNIWKDPSGIISYEFYAGAVPENTERGVNGIKFKIEQGSL